MLGEAHLIIFITVILMFAWNEFDNAQQSMRNKNYILAEPVNF